MTFFKEHFDDHGFPIVNKSTDGWSTESEATATCFCGSVQLILVSRTPPNDLENLPHAELSLLAHWAAISNLPG